MHSLIMRNTVTVPELLNAIRNKDFRQRKVTRAIVNLKMGEYDENIRKFRMT